jgi:hypothetical protein
MSGKIFFKKNRKKGKNSGQKKNLLQGTIGFGREILPDTPRIKRG